MLFFRERIAHVIAILMPRNALQFYVLSVQETALFMVKRYGTEANAGFYRINLLTAAHQRGTHSVEIGVFQPIPPDRVRKLYGELLTCFRFPLRHGFAVPIPYSIGGCYAASIPLNMRLDTQHTGVPLNGGVRIHAAKPCFQAKMALVQPGNQIHSAIEPAIKREIRVARIHILKIAIIHGDGNAVGPARIDVGGQIKTKERIAAFMRAGQFAIHRHRGYRIGGADFQVSDP